MSTLTVAPTVFASRMDRIEISATMAITAEAAKLRAGGANLVDFGAGEPHFATPQHIKDAAIRAISDYEFELQMALMNRRLDPVLETLFLIPAEEYSYVSSRLIKQVFRLGGSVDGLVPPVVLERMRRRAGE